MADTLADSLALALPHLSEALVAPGQRGALTRLARGQAPIHCAGFEARLDAGEQRTDFAQRILGFRGEPQTWAAHIEASGLATRSSPWRALHRFASAWATADSLIHTDVAGAWLEFDAPGFDTDGAVPSLFVSLLQQRGHGDEEALVALIAECFDLLFGRRLPAALADAVRSSAGACPAAAGVADVGFMLARDIEALRLAAAPFAPAEVAPFVRQLGRPGDTEDLRAALAHTGDDDELTVSLDLLGAALGEGASPDAQTSAGRGSPATWTVLPRVGIEIFPGPLPEDVPHWRQRLDGLVAAGICTSDKRDALLAWPGYVEPRAHDAWPAALLVESLLRPADEFSVLGLRLNHLKLSCTPGKPIGAKAYFGFGPLWLTPDAAPTASRPSGRHADETFPRAIEFLLEKQSADGCWRDFASIMGGSDEWVTAYVIAALAGCDQPQADAAADAGWRWLAARRGDDDGWGFNGSLPHDADGTAWGLLAAQAVCAEEDARLVAARAVLERHRTAAGGLASYLPTARSALRQTLAAASFDAFMQPHTCVTAAAANLHFVRPSLASYLVETQREDGSWRGFWWGDRGYATGLAATALAHTATPGGLAAAAAAGRWAHRRIAADGAVICRASGTSSAFANATGLLAISAAARVEGTSAEAFHHETEPALKWLGKHQRADGSWAPSAIMRIPPADAMDPLEAGSHGFTGVDDAAIFTTATVLRGLLAAVAYADVPSSSGSPSPLAE